MAQKIRTPLAALSVAMRARTGALEAHEVRALLDLARDECAGRDVLRQAVARFAGQYVGVRRNAQALAEAGAELQRAVEMMALVLPPGLDRSDIHG